MGKITEAGLRIAKNMGLTVSAANTVLSPGKFEGEHVSTLYFYKCWLDGDFGTSLSLDDDRIGYELSKEEQEELGGLQTFLLTFTEQGFVMGDQSPLPLNDLIVD